MNPDPINIDNDSPAIQTHLGILQSVIQRMASNSAAAKTWCVTLVSAVLVIVADKGKPEFAYIAFIPILLFFALDAYYLALEKAFRQSYNSFIVKLHTNTLSAEDLYSVVPQGGMSQHQFESIKSFSIWGFYIVLSILTYLVKKLALE